MTKPDILALFMGKKSCKAQIEQKAKDVRDSLWLLEQSVNQLSKLNPQGQQKKMQKV